MEILRGNLDTRLRKLREEGLDAVIVAASGVIRLGEQRQITQYLERDLCLSAIGQGTLALECREEDQEINEILRPLNAPDVSLAVRAERAFLERLEGGCQVPIAAYGEIENGILLLEGRIASVDGKELVGDKISGDPGDPEAIGRKLAERLLASGGKAILKDIYGSLSQD
jgi:hydroxymethylbilane synthase